MFNWKKLGHIFDPTEASRFSWMKEFAQSPSALVFDTFVRVYFATRSEPDNREQYVSRVGYVDLNKNDLFHIINRSHEPILSLGELGTFDEFGTNPVSIIRNGNEIRMYYCGWSRCESVPFNSAIGIAISNDNGISFNRIGKGPVLSYSLDEPFVIGTPRIRKYDNLWYLWYAAGEKWIQNDNKPEPIYKIRMAYSDDGFNWIKLGRNLILDKLEFAECQASPDVFFSDEQYHMFFSYRYNLNFKEKGRGYQIGYAYSKDKVNWIRDDSKVGIAVSETGWDSETISYPNVFELDGSIYMLYQGNEIGRYGFGIAILEGTL